MHPSSVMGNERKFYLLLCCVIPIYGFSAGINETKFIKPHHEEYDDPLYSLNVLRPVDDFIPYTDASEHLKESDKKQHYHKFKKLNINRKHLREYRDSYKYIEGEFFPPKYSKEYIAIENNSKENERSYKSLKERHSRQHNASIRHSITKLTEKASSPLFEPSSENFRRIIKQNKRLGRKYRRHDKTSGSHNQYQHFQEVAAKKRPHFGMGTTSMVISQIDSHAFLPCVVHELKDQTVSWIRNRDAHILTVNRYTFISGERFVSWFESDSDTWTLQIKFINEKDAGSYECQLSTEPKMSHFVNLSVIVPKVIIPEGRELYVRKGSDISLKCVISRAIDPPPYVFWYYGNDEFNRRVVHQGTVTSLSDKNSIATLVLKNAARRHAGNYTCAPSGISRSTSVILHVLNGEHPAAMQHGGNAVCKIEKNLLVISFMVISVINNYITDEFS